MPSAKEKKMFKMPGFAWRVSLSILTGVGWLIFLVLWLFFYADKYSIYQNIAVFIVSLLAIGGIMGAAWASWGIRYGAEYCSECGRKKRG